jgi:hypothetical protein
MQSASDALRSVSDELMRDLEALVSAEEEKRKVPPDDPRLVTLAAEVDQLARRVLGLTGRQQDIAEDVHEQAVEGGVDAPTEPIEETHRPIGLILAEWRSAERDVAAAAPGSAEAESARATADRLRVEYRRAYDALRK